MKLIITMADMGAVKCEAGDLLVTYSLGSCIAVGASDPSAGVGGLLHFMLPDSALAKAKAQRRPCMFADTGIAMLLRELEQLGADRGRLQIKLAGGAQVLDQDDFFAIGRQNHEAVQRLLRRERLVVLAEDVGGTDVRTVELEPATGRLAVRTADRRVRLL